MTAAAIRARPSRDAPLVLGASAAQVALAPSAVSRASLCRAPPGEVFRAYAAPSTARRAAAPTRRFRSPGASLQAMEAMAGNPLDNQVCCLVFLLSLSPHAEIPINETTSEVRTCKIFVNQYFPPRGPPRGGPPCSDPRRKCSPRKGPLVGGSNLRGFFSPGVQNVESLSKQAQMVRIGFNSPVSPQRVFCPGGARPPTQAMIAFIDDHRGAYGVEPICKVLPIAPRPTMHLSPGASIRPGCQREPNGMTP
jgi:hypothetical protein